ncbi:hypothetical protein F4677DRAFT_2890 [Hypoxylon crocopeplum]|nr:hypothetical protein F4677DRAFT_2890 [Hypoxylon crocopeplum]
MIAYEEPYYMIILRGKLEALLEQLEALAKDCQKLAEEPPPRKSFRAIWPWKRRKVLELYEEARLIQGHLNSAMGVFMNRALYNQGKLLAHIHDAVVGSSPRLTDDTNDNGTDIYGPKTLLGDLHPAFRISDPTSDVSRLYLLPSKKQQKNPCICSCHRPQARRTREVAYAPIPGKLSVSHSNVIDWIFPCRKCECSRPRALIRLDYQFPPWLWNRALVFKTSLSVLSGIGISLRIPTILRSNDPIWPALRSPRIEDVQRFISQKSYTATDTDRQGGSILEVRNELPNGNK